MDHRQLEADTEGTTDATGADHAACGSCAVGRRTALFGMGVVGLAGLLAACGDDGSEAVGAQTGDAAAPGTDEPTSADTTNPGTSEASPEPEETETGSGGSGASAEALATTGEVPVGGGVILHGPGIVVTQPSEGEFMAFTSTCTHQGCAVTQVSGGLITCDCHGSQFSVADGSVQTGPAQQALGEVAITVEGDQILAG